jgi:hypothetical protein
MGGYANDRHRSAKKAAILKKLCMATPPRGKRQLAGMFTDLVDREHWPQYYEASTFFLPQLKEKP